jgi:hypothetical protein
MRRVELDELDGKTAQAVLPSASDRVVLMRGGKPVAIVTDVSNLDEEDLRYIESPSFWSMIAARRKQKRITLEEAQRRLAAREARDGGHAEDKD